MGIGMEGFGIIPKVSFTMKSASKTFMRGDIEAPYVGKITEDVLDEVRNVPGVGQVIRFISGNIFSMKEILVTPTLDDLAMGEIPGPRIACRILGKDLGFTVPGKLDLKKGLEIGKTIVGFMKNEVGSRIIDFGKNIGKFFEDVGKETAKFAEARAREAAEIAKRTGETIKDTGVVIGKTFEKLGETVGAEAKKFGINVANGFIYIGNQIGVGFDKAGNAIKNAFEDGWKEFCSWF